MAIKELQTRIALKYDSYSAWTTAPGKDLVLLKGEIGICEIPSDFTANGDSQVMPTVLFKVGNGTSTFENLPWASAKAADVYGWAKKSEEEFKTWLDTTAKFATDAEVAAIVQNLEAKIAATLTAITINQTGDGVVKSVAKGDEAGEIDVTRALVVDTDIADGAIKTAKLDNKAVATEKLADAAVTNDKVANDIEAAKIVYSKGGTVDAKLDDLSAQVSSFKGGLSVISDPTDKAGVVQGIEYSSATGAFTVSYGTVAEGDLATDAVTEGKIKNGAVTTDKIADGDVTDAKIDTVSASKVIYTAGADAASTITLPEKIGEVESKISAINTAISGGVHFVGITTTEIADGSTTGTIKINNVDYIAKNGDIVLYKANATTAEDEEKEFIWVQPEGATSGHWEVLGDLSRVGVLEDWRNDLDYKGGDFGTHKFVTKVTQTDGLINATYVQPTSEDVTHAGSTVKAALEDLAANKADRAHEHADYVNQNAFSNIKVGEATVAADSTTDTVEFVGSNITITPDTTNDKITFAVAEGSTSKKGIVQLSDTNTGAVVDADSKTAATTKAVKEAYAKGAQGIADAAAAAERIDVYDNYFGVVDGVFPTTLIFNCGSATEVVEK